MVLQRVHVLLQNVPLVPTIEPLVCNGLLIIVKVYVPSRTHLRAQRSSTQASSYGDTAARRAA